MPRKLKEGICATCASCDVRNNGYCENETVRSLLEFSGIVSDPEAFGCVYWAPRKTEETTE